MAVEEGVNFTVRERIINHWVKLGKEANGDHPRYEAMLRRGGEQLADGVLSYMDLMGDEPEVAVKLHWIIGLRVNDPHDWDDIGTVVALLRWRRDGEHA